MVNQFQVFTSSVHVVFQAQFIPLQVTAILDFVFIYTHPPSFADVNNSPAECQLESATGYVAVVVISFRVAA
jgi:hypothetical protein